MGNFILFMRVANLIILLYALSSCGETPPKHYTILKGRDGIPLYRMELPASCENVPISGDPLDTKTPLLECHFEGLRLTVHNFPYATTEQRISPEAQINRWKGQLDTVDAYTITPQSFAGYAGLSLLASGTTETKPSGVLGWSLLLAPEHDRSLTTRKFPSQMRSDVTIKITGNPDRIEEHFDTLYQLARSFELISPLPNP